MRIHFLVIIHKIIQKKGDVKKMKDLEIFFKDVCISKSNARISCNTLYSSYILWCINNDEKPKNRKELGAYISSLGFSKVRQQYGTLFWVGLDITEEYHQKTRELGYA